MIFGYFSVKGTSLDLHRAPWLVSYLLLRLNDPYSIFLIVSFVQNNFQYYFEHRHYCSNYEYYRCPMQIISLILIFHLRLLHVVLPLISMDSYEFSYYHALLSCHLVLFFFFSLLNLDVHARDVSSID